MSIREIYDMHLEKAIQKVSQNVEYQWRNHAFAAISLGLLCRLPS